MNSLFCIVKKFHFLFFALLFLAFSKILFSQISFENRVEFSLEAGQYFTQQSEKPSVNRPEEEKKITQVRIQALYEECGAWSLIFHFPQPVKFKKEIQDGNLYLEFNQPVDSKDLIAAQEKVSSLIKRFSNGYNTLYLVAKRPVFYHMEADNKTFFLNIAPNQEAPIKMTKFAKIAAARLLVEKRSYVRAFNAIFALMNEYPDDKDVLVLYSSLEGLLPRWQNQVGILETILLQHPWDYDIKTLFYYAYSPHSSYIEGTRQMQRTIGLAAVQVYRLQGEKIVRSSPNSVLYAGAQYQLWDGHVSSILNSQGNAVGFRGWRNQGTLYIRNEWRDGSHLRLSLYDQKAAFGAGLEYGTLFPFFQGTIKTEFQWHRPTWEIFEALAFNGREDRFYSLMTSVTNRYFSWSLGGGSRRIGISGTPTGLITALASAQVFVNLFIPNPIFGINYSLDAEYILFRKSKIGADGVPFFPVPYTSFENHTLRAYLIYIFRDRWYISAYGGETFNRIGLKDATCGAEIRYAKPLPCGWEAKLSYDRFPSTIVSGATAEFLTGTLTYRF